MKTLFWLVAVFLLSLCPAMFVLPELGGGDAGPVMILGVNLYKHDRSIFQFLGILAFVAGAVVLTLAIRWPKAQRPRSN